MTREKLRRLRGDLGFLTSIALTVLVLVAVLTGTGVGEDAVEVLGLGEMEDWHAAVGYAMAAVASLHVLLNLGSMKTYAARRLRTPSRAERRQASPVGGASGASVQTSAGTGSSGTSDHAIGGRDEMSQL